MGRRLREKLSLFRALRQGTRISPCPSDKGKLERQTYQGNGQTRICRSLHIEIGLDIRWEDSDEQEDNPPRSPHTQPRLRTKGKRHTEDNLDDTTQGNERFMRREIGRHRAQVHRIIHKVIDSSCEIKEGTKVEPDEVKTITKHLIQRKVSKALTPYRGSVRGPGRPALSGQA